MNTFSYFTQFHAKWIALETILCPIVLLLFPPWMSFTIIGMINFAYVRLPELWLESTNIWQFILLQPYMLWACVLRRQYNAMALFWLGTMLGRQFCLVENESPFRHFVLTTSAMREWTWLQWFILYFFCTLIVTWVYAQYISGGVVHRAQWRALVALVVFVTLVSLVVNKNYELHVHHFIVFGVLLSMSTCRGTLTAFFDGIFYGAYVDGVAEWGLAMPWQAKSHSG